MAKELNRVLLMGRLTKEVDCRENGEKTVSRFTLAVGRDNDNADFINCVCFGNTATFADKYLGKGTKVAVDGKIRTGSYVGKDGNKVYTTDVVAENIFFAESKKSDDGFKAINMDVVTDDIQEELPFL